MGKRESEKNVFIKQSRESVYFQFNEMKTFQFNGRIMEWV